MISVPRYFCAAPGVKLTETSQLSVGMPFASRAEVVAVASFLSDVEWVGSAGFPFDEDR